MKNVGIKWNYKRQGMTVDDDLVVKVFAVEMVFVPSGPFEVGFRETSHVHTGGFVAGGTTNSPFKITGEKIDIKTGNNAGSLYTYNNEAPAFDANVVIPDTFPKGYAAFYMMKYELTQEAFAEMLNCIDAGAADVLTPGYGSQAHPWSNPINTPLTAYSELATASSGGTTRGYVIYNVGADNVSPNNYGSGRIVLTWQKGAGGSLTYGCDANRNNKQNETASYDSVSIGDKKYTRSVSIDGQDIPMHICSPYMLAAYAGFAGLRPMTEFEYEKACRGDVPAKTNEYAWGSSSGTAGDYLMNHGRWDVATGNVSSVYKNINKGNEKLNSSVGGFGTGGIVYSGHVINAGWWMTSGNLCHPGFTSRVMARYRQAQLVRVGSFADTNTDRQSSGASYWGIMNLSDNAYEYAVLAQSISGGLQYNGEHGNGILIFDNLGVYPDGKNNWRLPNNTTKWWTLRGVFLYTLTEERQNVGTTRTGVWWGACGTHPAHTLTDLGYGLLANGWLSNKNTGYVGYRALAGATGYANQKNGATFAGIRCVRTADTTTLK